jgi:hypothetical protein
MEIQETISGYAEKEAEKILRLESEKCAALARISGFQDTLKALNGNANAIFKRKVEERIQKDEQLVGAISIEINAARGRKSAFDDSLRLLEKTSNGGFRKGLRASSELAAVERILMEAGRELALTDILRKLGKESDEKKRISLRGSLRAYARDGRVFTLGESQDSFGLLDYGQTAKQSVAVRP